MARSNAARSRKRARKQSKDKSPSPKKQKKAASDSGSVDVIMDDVAGGLDDDASVEDGQIEEEGSSIIESPERQLRSPSPSRASIVEDLCCCKCGMDGELVVCGGCERDFHPECGGDTTFAWTLSSELWFCTECKSGPHHHDPQSDDEDNTGLDDSPDPQQSTTFEEEDDYHPFADDGAVCSSCAITHEEQDSPLVCCIACTRTFHIECGGTEDKISEIKRRQSWICSDCIFAEDDEIDDDDDDDALSGDTAVPALSLDEVDLDQYEEGEPDEEEEDEDEDEDAQTAWPGIRLTAFSVDELSHMGIGKPAVREEMTSEEELTARLKFKYKYQAIIDKHKRWAKYHGSLMDPAMRITLNAWSNEQWWEYVLRSHSEERQVEIGNAGENFTLKDFLALPPIAAAELRGWVIYGNYSRRNGRDRTYAGSATSLKEFAWSRLAPYEKSLRRVQAGGPPYSVVSRAHAAFAFVPEAENLFRVFAVPPMEEGRLRAHVLEGMTATLIGAFHEGYVGRHWGPELDYALREHLPESMKGMKFDGLCHAHQYCQSFNLTQADFDLLLDAGARSRTIGEALKEFRGGQKTCECCNKARSTNGWRWRLNPFPRSLVNDDVVCYRCTAKWREQKASMSPAEFVASRALMTRQHDDLAHLRGTMKKCECCGIEWDVPATARISLEWARNPFDKDKVADDWICVQCRGRYARAGYPEGAAEQDAVIRLSRKEMRFIALEKDHHKWLKKYEGDELVCPCCRESREMPENKNKRASFWREIPSDIEPVLTSNSIPVICLSCCTVWNSDKGIDLRIKQNLDARAWVKKRRTNVAAKTPDEPHTVFLREYQGTTLKCRCCLKTKEMQKTKKCSMWRPNPFDQSDLDALVICAACYRNRMENHPDEPPRKFIQRRRNLGG